MVHQLLIPTEEQQGILRETAQRLAPHVHQVIHHWSKTYREMDRTIDTSALYEMEQMYRAYFKMLLGELNKELLYDRIAAAAKRLSRMQVTFDHLILSFHLFEDSCLPYIKQVYSEKEKLVEAMVAMDYMCHSCFSAIASSYFQEKYGKKTQFKPPEKTSRSLTQTYKLTPRELEILKRIVDGYKNREVADILKISVKTVEHHRANLMRKLGVHNVANLIKITIRNPSA